jgi:hypothetical protein
MRQPWLLSLIVLAAAVGLAPGAARGAGAVAHVVAHVVGVDGLATATTPGGGTRTLVCGDPIHADERIETRTGSRLVIARDGRHVHLGPESLWVVHPDGSEPDLSVLLRGDARILDTRDLPASRVATSAGPLRSEAVDLELHRVADGSLEVCDWSRGEHASCRRVDPEGRVWPSVSEGPRVDLAIGQLCPWRERKGFVVADFISPSPPPVAAPPAGPAGPEFEPDPEEPGCAGDECTPGPELPPEHTIEWTIDPPTSFIP